MTNNINLTLCDIGILLNKIMRTKTSTGIELNNGCIALEHDSKL